MGLLKGEIAPPPKNMYSSKKSQLSFAYEMTPEKLALVGGTAGECPIAVSVAMASSQLDCSYGVSYRKYDENNADRGLFGFNTLMHPEIDDKCAYNCQCSVEAAIKMSRSRVGWKKFVRYGGKEYLAFMPMAAPPCNKVMARLSSPPSWFSLDAIRNILLP